jgi:coenzyme F420-reducing hydrogenase alpha subunit
MQITREIHIPRLTRVEGHGNIRIRVQEGKIAEASWEIVETPRVFEAMMVGKMWESLPWLSGRICGICSIGHTLASIRAIENCFGFTPPAQTERLRLLLKHMETLQSHILHIFFLAAPDYLKSRSVLELRATHPAIVELAVRLKKLANDGADLIGGRRLHPTRLVVGGFTIWPEEDELRELAEKLRAAVTDLEAAAKFLQGVALPEFQRETEYVSLQGQARYPFIGGRLCSSDGVVNEEQAYLEMTNEYHVDHSTAKWARLSRESFSVGALARINNNGHLLHQKAAAMAERFNLRPICHNPFMLPLAQLVECMHVVEDSLELIKEIHSEPIPNKRESLVPRAGTGVGAVEVPRGILYHCYTFDQHGRVTNTDCVIPTSQNHGNIQQDLNKLANEAASAGMSDKEIEHLASMLVRAYDPCISCSVH